MTASTDPMGSTGQTRIVGKGSATAEGPGPYVMAASTLEGDKVLCSDGNEVGKIKEIMLDTHTGRIAYAVMSVGGFLGIGDKLLAIPWNALTLDTDRKCFQLSVPSDTVKNAPGFDKNHWPAMADVAWANELHDYYGSAPYWRASRGDMTSGGIEDTGSMESGTLPGGDLPH